MKIIMLVTALLSCSVFSYAESTIPWVVKSKAIELNSKNTVVFRGTVDSQNVLTASLDLAAKALKRGTADYPIYLVLDSPGGSIDDGEDFIAFAKTFKNVQTISIFAASMASAIVQALPGKRLITENGILMFHRAKGGVSGQFETGELESRLAFYKNIVRSMEQRSANRMSMPLSEYKAKVKDELWLVAKEAVAQKAADAIVAIECSQELIDAKTAGFVQVFIFQIKVEYSGCPLLRTATAAADEPEDKVLKYKKWLKTRPKFNAI